MREIKFRTWILRLKRFHYWGWGDIEGDQSFFTGPVLDKTGIQEQFTGLQDKNGQDIYEGDILQFPAIEIGLNLKGKWAIAIVEEDGGCSYSLMGIKPLDFEGSEESLSDVSVGCELKVIGNIHENPELLA